MASSLSSSSLSASSSSVPSTLSHLVRKEKPYLPTQITFRKTSPVPVFTETTKTVCSLVNSHWNLGRTKWDTWQSLSGRQQMMGRNSRNEKKKITFFPLFGKSSLLCKAYKNPNGNSQTPLSRDRAPTSPLDYPSPSPSPSPQESVHENTSSFDTEKKLSDSEKKLSDSEKKKNFDSEEKKNPESSNSKPIPLPSHEKSVLRTKKYRNNVLWLMGLRLQIKKEVDKVLKSELVRRVVVTLFFLGVSRIGQCILLPGFDRRIVSASRTPNMAISGGLEQLLQSGIPLNFFEIGLIPFIFANMIVQILVEFKVVPSWSKLREEGKDGMEALKKISWRMSAAAAFVFGTFTSFHFRQFSVFSYSSPIRYYFFTSSLLALGSIIYVWIGDRITEDGLGHGSSALIACSILSASTDSLALMFRTLSGFPPFEVFCLAVGWLFCFFVMTAGASFLLGARREIELEYFDTEYTDGPYKEEGLEGRPYVPFPLAPDGVTPVFYAHYMLLIPQSLQSSGIGFPFEFGPDVPGVGGIVYNLVFVFFILLFNCVDTADVPGKLSQYMVKIGARVRKTLKKETKKKHSPIMRIGQRWWEGLVWGVGLVFWVFLKPFGINGYEFGNRIKKIDESINDPPKPGDETKKYLQRVHSNTRFVGGVILAMLSLGSNHLDTYLHRYLKGSSIGFTSMLIIVGSVIALRRTVEAYQQMPQLERIISKYKFDLQT